MVRRFAISLLVIFSAVPARAQVNAAVQSSEPQAAVSAPSAATFEAMPKSELVLDGKPLGPPVAPRADDFCIVCKRPLGREGVVHLVDGQRVPLHFAVCYERFAKAPRMFLSTLQPHGAFLGVDGGQQNLSFAWFLGGLYVLLGLIFAALCAHRALQSGRNPAGWFAAGMFLNVLGYVLLLTRPRLEIQAPCGVPAGLAKLPTTYAPKQCPKCKETNHPGAEKCASCGENLKPVVKSEVARAGLRST